jgi:uncharacterized protein (DUF983 family)
MTASGNSTEPTIERNRWTAMKRGFMGRCPHCGEGRIFHGYLKVNQACPVCHEELHHQRADDAPPYFTILVVGHVIGAMMLAVEEHNDQLPIWIHATVWPILTVAMCLWLLPRFKGALIGLQWALRMHGFATPTMTLPQAQPAS